MSGFIFSWDDLERKKPHFVVNQLSHRAILVLEDVIFLSFSYADVEANANRQTPCCAKQHAPHNPCHEIHVISLSLPHMMITSQPYTYM